MIQVIFLCGAGYWIIWTQDEKRIIAADISWDLLQGSRITGINKHWLKTITLLVKGIQQRLWWFGHIRRMPGGRMPHNALHARFKGKRNKGRPSLCWTDNVNEVITSLGLTLRGAMKNDKDWNKLFVPITAWWLASLTDDDIKCW